MTEIVLAQSTQLLGSGSTAITEATHSAGNLISLFVATKRSTHTKKQYTHSVDMLLSFNGKPLGEVTLQDAVGYHEWLKTQYSSAHSIKLHINVAKALCGFGVSLNYLRTNVFAVIKTDTPSEVTHKRILSEEDVLRLIDAPKRVRDKVMLRLIYAAGLRVSEVTGLVWDDLSADGVLHIRHGKGQKQRFVTLSDGMVKRLGALREGAAADAPIFRSNKGGHFTTVQVNRIVKAAAKVAGISEDASAHWLRHSHASHSLDRGASIVTVRDTLGHSSIATTNKYLHAKRKDSSALHLAV